MIKVGYSSQVSRRYILRKLLCSFLIASSLLVPPIVMTYADPANAIVGVLYFPLAFYGGFFGLAFFCNPLKVVAFKNQMYWIAGCSSEYLASLQAMEPAMPKN
ncbi:hypothetical protein HG15A2_21950 [Adhaeretor mobilis]|uniref:Uncharacterized protein n=1 Tax=Adhaeretor mobilis TaxID=1930276 RepID=A0A517MVT5_9BACT|nr:hypothetical protein HG15A2_21950 [Adhaeretor mobilis]